MNKINVGILGSTGYTGCELLRIIYAHPHVNVSVLTSQRFHGQHIGEIFPTYHFVDLPVLSSIDQADFSSLDLVFCALPHGQSHEQVKKIPPHVKVIDLSADFRLSDPEVYEQWYHVAHQEHELQKTAVYGLTELHKEKIKSARLIANPGCYPTLAQLCLVPIVEKNLISCDDIIINAMSGVSGAGRSVQTATLYCEVSQGARAYGIGNHRHCPEIEQGLTWVANKEVKVSFTPHIIPINRGILETIYVKKSNHVDVRDIHKALSDFYADEPFVHLLDYGCYPQIQDVKGSNHVRIGVMQDRLTDRVIIIGVEDNLIKGASGQGVQNMNLMFGFDPTCGLLTMPLFP